MRSVSSVLAVRTTRSAKQFARRTARRDFRRVDAGAGQDGVEGGGELAGAVADEEPEAPVGHTYPHQLS
jgi:hypothetical protein